MARSPGHQKHPEHKVEELPVDHRLKVEVDGTTIAESENVIRIDEDHHPDRFYFPRHDVRMERLERSETTTECPFKGEASHFHLGLDDRQFDDAAWSYERPYDEHQALEDRIAFYDDKISQIRIVRADIHRPTSNATRSTDSGA